MKTLLSLLLIFSFSCSFSLPVDYSKKTSNCKKAPKEALLTFDAPYKNWFNIECNDIQKSHFLTPQKGYIWKGPKGSKDFKFHAFGIRPPKFEIGILALNTFGPHKYYFLKSKHRELTGKHLDDVNTMLEKSTGQKATYKKIVQFDIISNTKNHYNLFIYLENNTPQWILGCVNKCATSVPLKVQKEKKQTKLQKAVDGPLKAILVD